MFLLHTVLAHTVVFTVGLQISKGLLLITSSRSAEGEEGNHMCYQ